MATTGAGQEPTQVGTSANAPATLSLELRRRRLVTDEHGRRVWTDEARTERVPAAAAAVLVCDVWDRHWSNGASRRVDELAPRIDSFCRRMRAAGCPHRPRAIGRYQRLRRKYGARALPGPFPSRHRRPSCYRHHPCRATTAVPTRSTSLPPIPPSGPANTLLSTSTRTAT